MQNSCLENPHGQRSLAGHSPRSCKESDTTEATQRARILINSVGIVSGGQQRNSAIHMHAFILPQTPLLSRLTHNTEQSSMCRVLWAVCTPTSWLSHDQIGVQKKKANGFICVFRTYSLDFRFISSSAKLCQYTILMKLEYETHISYQMALKLQRVFLMVKLPYSGERKSTANNCLSSVPCWVILFLEPVHRPGQNKYLVVCPLYVPRTVVSTLCEAGSLR